jgi:hypothetical protein
MAKSTTRGRRVYSNRAKVSAGQHIAFVGHQFGSTMLHLELFSNPASLAGLTKMGNTKYDLVPAKNYNRRSDLDDPTTMLDWLIVMGE